MKRGGDRRLGPAYGVRRGWRPVALLPSEILDIFGTIDWLDVGRRGDLVAWRAWRTKHGIKRIDALFADDALLKLVNGTRTRSITITRVVT